ncbi:unnamed protein product [Ectocarpus sp. 8 AP-2014]
MSVRTSRRVGMCVRKQRRRTCVGEARRRRFRREEEYDIPAGWCSTSSPATESSRSRDCTEG